jgi:MbtH protein
MSVFDDEKAIFKVLVNHEEQYSLWPEGRDNPLGWNTVGKPGTKQECLEYIKTIWTDMRPLSLRKKMDNQESTPSQNLARKVSSGQS